MPTTATTAHPSSTGPLDIDASAGDLVQPGHPLFGVVWINPDRLSGTPCFYETRVPVSTLFDYLEGGDSLSDFLEGFPGVTHARVLALLSIAQQRVLAEFTQR